MTEEQNKGAPGAPANPKPTVEVLAPSTFTTADMSRDGTAKVTSAEEDSHSVNLGRDGKVIPSAREAQEAEGDELPEDLQGSDLDADIAEKSPPKDASEDGAEEGTEDNPAGDLPEFDLASEETVKAYDAKYTMQDEAGDTVINLNAFNDELAANLKDGKTDLNPGSRAYLKKVFGISDGMINNHLRNLEAQAESYDASIRSKFDYDGAIEWVKTGYSDAQKASYNAALKDYQKTGDHSKLDEQLELLQLRFETANPAAKKGATKETAPGQRFRDRRPSSPEKQATKVTTTASKGEDLFANSEDHRQAQHKAEQSGDPAQMRAVSEKLRRSMKQKGWA